MSWLPLRPTRTIDRPPLTAKQRAYVFAMMSPRFHGGTGVLEEFDDPFDYIFKLRHRLRLGETIEAMDLVPPRSGDSLKAFQHRCQIVLPNEPGEDPPATRAERMQRAWERVRERRREQQREESDRQWAEAEAASAEQPYVPPSPTSIEQAEYAEDQAWVNAIARRAIEVWGWDRAKARIDARSTVFSVRRAGQVMLNVEQLQEQRVLYELETDRLVKAKGEDE